MRSDHLVSDSKIEEFISQMLQKGPRLSDYYQQPSTKSDILCTKGYSHEFNQPNCDRCDRERVVTRSVRRFPGPEIHYGLIASGDTVMRSSSSNTASYFEDVLCFEMEAAGLMTEYSCLVIRGISDYADSHKNDKWQCYAAATAAACTKELLSYLQPNENVSAAAASSFPLTRDDRPVLNKTSHFSGSGIQHTGAGTFSVGGDVNIG
ncbi:hypothetical protein M431DRAFT_546207 [Trichoderma harzianum CBS 226.95]|uniref:Nucleoside phosphorylase domain-containing protein n=1 Tax=Trichoderma harzianum CBS 226.95 TaxID=983964 RepID=A0A2T3ZVN3_TRIHA|nr:hypothetical protein M431DRAFT_546207 [Trichoderma harzianum CBS 226.95]PTB48871.1 hypothetical protein M431DRAFT_546207 [Trichoderma harzianum CBS 226.95]